LAGNSILTKPKITNPLLVLFETERLLLLYNIEQMTKQVIFKNEAADEKATANNLDNLEKTKP